MPVKDMSITGRHQRVFVEDPVLESQAAKVLLYKRLFFEQTGSYTKERTTFLQAQESLKCQYCEVVLDSTMKRLKPTIDHIIPMSRNCNPLDTSNWAVACTLCNGIRGKFTQVPKSRYQEAFEKYLRKAPHLNNAPPEFLEKLYERLCDKIIPTHF